MVADLQTLNLQTLNLQTLETCGTCKHWRQFDDNRDNYSHSYISKHQDTENIGTCDKIMHAKKEVGNWLAAMVDASDYFAVLMTHDRFGCPLHDPRADAIY